MSSVLVKSFLPDDNDDDKDDVCITLSVYTALYESHNLRAAIIVMQIKKIPRFREIQLPA